MHIIQRMREEHRRIAKVLAIIDHEIQSVGLGENIDFSLIQDAVRYLADYPDTVHHPKEELIFAQLAKIDPSSETIIARLEQDHRTISEKTKAFAELIEELVLECLVPRNEVVKMGVQFVRINYDHMATEEQEIFPRVLSLFTTKDWESLTNKLPDKHDPMFDGSVEKTYQILFDNLVQHA